MALYHRSNVKNGFAYVLQFFLLIISLCFSTGYENDDAYTMEIFDTRSVRSYKVVDVLKASCDAPVVFETPTTIKGVHYVDGGVGGNCPLVQAIPRMQELHNSKKLACKSSRPNSALSIAPPQLDGNFLKLKLRYLYFICLNCTYLFISRRTYSSRKSGSFLDGRIFQTSCRWQCSLQRLQKVSEIPGPAIEF